MSSPSPYSQSVPIEIKIDENGDTSPAHVPKKSFVFWSLAKGGPFCVHPPKAVKKPLPFSLQAGQRSLDYEVVGNPGNHEYEINAGNCPGTERESDTGAQMIIIETDLG